MANLCAAEIGDYISLAVEPEEGSIATTLGSLLDTELQTWLSITGGSDPATLEAQLRSTACFMATNTTLDGLVDNIHPPAGDMIPD